MGRMNLVIINDVMGRAKKNSLKNKYGVGCAGKEHYSAEYVRASAMFRLMNHGTMIFKSIDGNVLELGGYSRSDMSAIDSAMSFVGFNGRVLSNKPKVEPFKEMNGWFIVPR